MDPLRNLYAQVNQAGGRLQQQQQPQQIQQQLWAQQQQQQQWPPQQQAWQQQWTPIVQENSQPQQRWPSPPPRRSNTPPAQWPSAQAFHKNYQQQQQYPSQPQQSYPQQQYAQQSSQAQHSYPQQQQYRQQSSYYQPQQSYPQQQQDYYGPPQGAAYDDGFRAVPIQQQQQPLVPFKKRLSDAIVPEPSAIVAQTRQGEASSSSRQQLQQQQLIYNTLTEPVSATLARDVKRVAFNLQQIVIPTRNRREPARTLRDWDLWGPFFFIIAMSCILSSSASENKSTVFAVVFAVLSAGAVSLTMNVVLLGGKLNFLQSLSVLGYCLFPLDIGAILCLASTSKFYRTIVVLFTFLWSSWSVYPFVSTAVRRSRKALAVYPVVLMYISMGFLVLANG